MSARTALLRRLGAVASTSGSPAHAAAGSRVSAVSARGAVEVLDAKASTRDGDGYARVDRRFAHGRSIGEGAIASSTARDDASAANRRLEGTETRASVRPVPARDVMRWMDSGARPAAGFRGYAAAASGSASRDGDASSEDAATGEVAGNDADDEVNVGSAAAGDVASVDPESLPQDDELPAHLMRPSWLQKKRTRKQKGSYEGFLTEIDSYPEFEPPTGALYNVSDFAAKTVETDPGMLKRLTQNYVDAQKAIYENNGGETGLSDEAFIQRYNASFEVAEEEKEKQIITWEVTMVHEAGGDDDHPLNRKVVMRVSGADLQRETGVSDEALAYMWEICGPRYDAKKDELRIVCSRSRNREHNRQWCLKVLYDLIMEGNREFPSESYRFTPEGPVEPSSSP